jgi:recombinational DNA repair protein (RecF pathway)
LLLPWGLLALALVTIAVISVSVIAVSGYFTPSFSICLTCHGTGEAAYKIDLKIFTPEQQCVESREYMKAKHMDLLNEWKESVVREGKRIYVATDGKQYEMSLTRTCLECHWNTAKFCDRCHNYAKVEYARPRFECWDCHTSRERS